MDYAFEYVRTYGLEREEDYPYTASDGVCAYDSTKVVGHVKSFTDV